ncbi:MAG TPA: hypothetical protein ENJ20_02300 [Bacteroidetes bacterium]|nr:hypothetical protein [Bacteroidota bacterium]
MDNLFAEFLAPDSIFIMLVALGSFLIGFLTAWLMWNGAAKRYENQAQQWQKRHDELNTKYGQLKEELELKEADLVKAKREAKEAIEIAKSLEAEKDKWQADLDAAIQESVNAQASISAYQATIEDLNNQIVGLNTTKAGAAPDEAEMNAALTRITELEEEISQLKAEKENLPTERINNLEAKIKELEAENNDLQAQIEQLKETQTGTGTTLEEANKDLFAATPETANVDKGQSLTLTAIAARDEVMAAIGSSIPAASEADKDDLTLIRGIGSFLEKKLNNLGIYTFEQISRFDEAMIEKVTAAIEFFPGRIERDDWVGQAKKLLGSKKEATSAPVIKPDDLKIVEGIGPKIETLLKDNGITDLETLSNAKTKRLREILDSAGPRYHIHDPATWPKQAALAVKGQLDKLKKLQDELKGGRKIG